MHNSNISINIHRSNTYLNICMRIDTSISMNIRMSMINSINKPMIISIRD